MVAWKFDAETPVYLQIERRICADILSGKYPADTQLPSVRQFALEAAVNPNTVQKALCELETKRTCLFQRERSADLLQVISRCWSLNTAA